VKPIAKSGGELSDEDDEQVTVPLDAEAQAKPSGRHHERRSLQSRATIRDIAMEAGVSTATVSRVINSPQRVSPSRREAVQQVMARHDYVMHGMAGALARAKSVTIGLVIPTITNSIYAAFTHAIQKVAQQNNYSVLLGVSDFDPAGEDRLIRRLIERRVDGLILTGGDRDPSIYRALERNGIPFVMTWRLAQAVDCPCVAFDNYGAGRLAMKHLTDLGHRRIGLICGRTAVNDRALERRRAYEDALAGLGVAFDSSLIFERDFEFIEGQTAMRRMLRLAEPPTAVFAANDIQAIGAISACRDAGVQVPRDLSIIGFDDLPVAEFSNPKLTTIHVPGDRMGHLAAMRIFEMINGTPSSCSEVLGVELVVRESTDICPADRKP
jgi:LacI family transcriptional regulator